MARARYCKHLPRENLVSPEVSVGRYRSRQIRHSHQTQAHDADPARAEVAGQAVPGLRGLQPWVLRAPDPSESRRTADGRAARAGAGRARAVESGYASKEEIVKVPVGAGADGVLPGFQGRRSRSRRLNSRSARPATPSAKGNGRRVGRGNRGAWSSLPPSPAMNAAAGIRRRSRWWTWSATTP